MDDKRKFNRWSTEEERAFIDLEGKREQVQIIDISIGGMRITSDAPIDKDKRVTGEFRILPNIGSFFVRGRVIWVTKRQDDFESGIQFDKVSTIPLTA